MLIDLDPKEIETISMALKLMAIVLPDAKMMDFPLPGITPNDIMNVMAALKLGTLLDNGIMTIQPTKYMS